MNTAKLKIGVIGAGRIGSTVARLFTTAGHEVAISNSRGPGSLVDLAQALGPRAHAMTVDQAALYADVVLLAVPWRALDGLPHPGTVRNKIVIDAMNPYSEDGDVVNLGERTSSELVAERLPETCVVKAFNTLNYKTLADGPRPAGDDRLALFVAGDDPEAKTIVAELVEELGFAPVDTGSLRDGGRKQQPGAALYNKPLTAAQAREALG